MRIRELPYRTLCNKTTGFLIGKLFKDLVPNRGLRFATDHPSITPEIKASLALGLYEREEVRLVRNHARTDLDVLDLGSSLGVIASHIGRRMESGRRLVCIEANTQLLHHLRLNVLHNAPCCDLTVLHAAIHYEATESDLFFRPGKTNVEGSIQDAASAAEDHSVSPLTLEKLVSDLSVKGYLLICDVEGAEVGMILEDPALDRCDQLIIELHDTTYRGHPYSVDMLANFLQEMREFTLLVRLRDVFLFDRIKR